MIPKGIPLSQQEVLYAELEGKHGAMDEDRDHGRFYMSMTQRMKHNHKALITFLNSYNEHLDECT